MNFNSVSPASHIKEGDEVLHDEGPDHPDLQAACGEAIEGLRQIVGDADPLRLIFGLDPLGQVARDALSGLYGSTLKPVRFRTLSPVR